MNVNSKHLATFLLGAAAALGAYKYSNLSDEEKEKLANDMKDKANRLKKTAVDAEGQAMEYFHELKTKGADALKEYLPKVDEFIESVFKGGNKATTASTAETSSTTTNPS
jgi:hypothetical protein